MVIKEIAKLCKERKNIQLFADRRNRVQWISDGIAAYPLYGMPWLDEDTVLTVMDIEEKDREKYRVKAEEEIPDEIHTEDTDDTEKILPPPGLSIQYKGQLWQPAITSMGLYFFNPKYLRPLKDLEEPPEIYEREAESGTPYLVAKAGLMVVAVILPRQHGEELLQCLTTLAQELRNTIESLPFSIDPETGEILGKA